MAVNEVYAHRPCHPAFLFILKKQCAWMFMEYGFATLIHKKNLTAIVP